MLRCTPPGRIDLRGSGVQADLLSCGWYHLLGVTHDGAALIRLRPNSIKNLSCLNGPQSLRPTALSGVPP